VGQETFFLFFQQYHNGKGGNNVTVGEAKMECLVDAKKKMQG
jgi:hypothetical protein